jgi:SlyX protein
MTDDALITRIEELESRLMHQEASIEELTRNLLEQGQLLTAQTQAMIRLEAQLRSLSDPHTLPSGEESPPPHY